MSNPTQIGGVYLLTPDTDARAFDAMLDVVEQVLNVGVRVVQYRDKTVDMQQRLQRASRLVALAHAAGALLIVNDSVQVAIDSDADGVHLGRDDGDLAQARSRLGDRLLGVSCYDALANAHKAVAGGADALAFGSMFASFTKPAAVRAPLSLLTAARTTWPQQRIVAIGGITTDNIMQVAQAGAHAAATLDAVFGAKNPAHAARELIVRFDEGRCRHAEQRTTV